MTLSGNASGPPSDDPELGAVTPTVSQQQQADFDIDVFLRTHDNPVYDEQVDQPDWFRRLQGHNISGSLGDIAFSATISALKKMSGAALMMIIVIFVVFGPNAPSGLLTGSILSGGPDEADVAQCSEVSEWYSLFDQHTERIYQLANEAGPPDTWDEVTLTQMAMLLPVYAGEWLAEMQKHTPPPVGDQLNALYIAYLKNYSDYILAIQEGDVEAQKYLLRENMIIQARVDIENRHILNICF